MNSDHNQAALPGNGRILVVAPRMRYLNATTENYICGLERRFDVVLYGPGYTDDARLHCDLREVFDSLGPFDAVIVHQYFALATLEQAVGGCWFGFDVSRFLARFPKFPEGLDKLPCPVFALCTLLDQYAMGTELRARLEAFPGYVITWPHDSFIHRTALDTSDGIVHATAEFESFSAANRSRVIPVHHTIDPREFAPVRHPRRISPAAVPGRLYERRRRDVAALAQSGYIRATKPPWLWLTMAATLGNPLRFRASIAVMRSMFRRQLARTKICVTDGSQFDMPVRKYFEIPASGSLLMAYPCNGLAGIGHVDGETYVRLDDGTDLVAAIEAVLSDPERIAQIAERGQALIRSCHTSDRRAAQFEACLGAINARRYAGADWIAGELVLVEQPA